MSNCTSVTSAATQELVEILTDAERAMLHRQPKNPRRRCTHEEWCEIIDELARRDPDAFRAWIMADDTSTESLKKYFGL